MDLLNLGIKSIFIENMVFAYFLGMCSFLAVSKKVSTAFGLGLAVVFVLGMTVPMNWLLNEFVLKEGALAWLGADFATIDLSFLRFIMFIAIIAAMVQLVEMTIEKFLEVLMHFSQSHKKLQREYLVVNPFKLKKLKKIINNLQRVLAINHVLTK